MAELDYMANHYSDSDNEETREEYDERISKRKRKAAVADVVEANDCKPAAKIIDYHNLSVCSSSDEDENEFMG
jgi:hypothetical protein